MFPTAQDSADSSELRAHIGTYACLASVRAGVRLGSDPSSFFAGARACKVGAADEMEALFVAIDDDG